MKTASMVLGIVGGIVTILLALIMILIGLLFGYTGDWLAENGWNGSVRIDGDNVEIDGDVLHFGNEDALIQIDGTEVRVQNGKVSINGDEVFDGDEDHYSVSIDDDSVIINGEHIPFRARGWARFGINVANGVLWVLAVIVVVGGILGIIGGAMVKRNNVLGGILMLVAAFLGSPAVLPFVLFLVGGILALINEKPPVRAPQPPPVA